MTGVAKAEMIGKGSPAYSVAFYGECRPLLVDLLEGDGPAAAAFYDHVERRERTLLAEAHIASLYGGAGADVWIAASPLLDKQGRRSGAIESVRNVSERKRAQDQLTKLSLAVEQSPGLRGDYQSPGHHRIRQSEVHRGDGLFGGRSGRAEARRC